MTLYEVAQLIPPKHRVAILLNNHVYKAVTKFEDWDMMQLWFYWANFIEKDSLIYQYKIENGKIIVEQQCLKCLRSLLDKWQAILPHLIELEKESQLLQKLK